MISAFFGTLLNFKMKPMKLKKLIRLKRMNNRRRKPYIRCKYFCHVSRACHFIQWAKIARFPEHNFSFDF